MNEAIVKWKNKAGEDQQVIFQADIDAEKLAEMASANVMSWLKVTGDFKRDEEVVVTWKRDVEVKS